jgi:hypothetical protein
VTYGARMRFRVWLTVGVALLIAGLGAGAFAYPLSPDPDGSRHDLGFAVPFADPGGASVSGPGTHAIWQAGKTKPDGDRCRVTGPDGQAVPMREPRLLVRWEPDLGEDAVDAYTMLATFDLPARGEYKVECTADPDAPGAGFLVTDEPDTTVSLGVGVVALVALLAGLAVLVLTVLDRRSRLHEVK